MGYQSWHDNRIDGDVFSFFCFDTDGSMFFVHKIISKVNEKYLLLNLFAKLFGKQSTLGKKLSSDWDWD